MQLLRVESKRPDLAAVDTVFCLFLVHLSALMNASSNLDLPATIWKLADASSGLLQRNGGSISHHTVDLELQVSLLSVFVACWSRDMLGF